MKNSPEKKKEILDPVTALEKIKNWCVYQERYQQEARDKLYEMGLMAETIENLIAILISEKFIDEERYARAYARGKFRIKKWGKIKIRVQLKAKRISEYSLKKAMEEIDEEEYLKTLHHILEEKRKSLHKEGNLLKKNYKLLRFAQSRGFETDLIMEALRL